MSLAARLGDNIRKLRHRRKSSVASHWYLPIDTHRGEIRLLHLLPGEWNDVISVYTSKARLPLEGRLGGSVQHVHISTEPAPLVRSYEALSYTWGSKEQCVDIFLDGKFGFSLTRNLWLALRRLRLENDLRFLWIDAICINQEDSDERTAQIQLMGLIFKNASQVTVWLGESFDSDRRIGTTEHNVNFYEGASDVLQRAVRNTTPSWWTRTWVVQEFVSASEPPLVQFGPYCVEWAQLGILTSNLNDRMGAHSSAVSLPAAQGDMEKARELVKCGKGTLFQLLRILGDLEASDKKDTVYSLLGMIDRSEARLVSANYEDSVATAFAKATYASIRFSKTYDILMLLSFSEKISQPPDLPSWAFNFAFDGDRQFKLDDWTRVAGDTVRTPTEELMSSEPTAWTATQVSRTNEIAAEFQSAAMTLAVRGLIFDYVSDIVQLDVSGESHTRWKVSQMKPLFQQLMRGFSNGDPYAALSDIPAPAFMRSHSAFSEGMLQALDDVQPSSQIMFFRSALQDVLEGLFRGWQALASTSPVEVTVYHLFKVWLTSLVSRKLRAAFFVTRYGFIGLASSNVKTGDTIALWTGCPNPAVLRYLADGRHSFQGFAYVHGIMDGELHVHAPKAQLPEKRFVLV